MHDPDAKDPCHKTYMLCQLAEEAGFDFLSIGHHVFTPDYPTSAPFAILSAIAARTSRIRLASVIYLLPLYHPVAVAEQVATLDLISGGRVIFGIGVGYRGYEFEGFGVDPHHRGARADESMAAIRSAWTTGRFNHHGRHFQIPDLPAVPLPIQKPHPPMWVGGVSEPALGRAARLGDAWISANMQPLDDVNALSSKYRTLCAQENKPAFVCISRDSWVAATREEMIRDWYNDTVNRHLGFKRMGFVTSDPKGIYARLERGESVSPEEFIQDRAIAGTPSDCIGQIRHWRESSGCQAMLILLSKKASFEKLCSVIKMFGTDVLPAARTDALT
ncbi:MAG: LLM class flavin-dependent oxidoreductase [Georgfuchsia sp.]